MLWWDGDFICFRDRILWWDGDFIYFRERRLSKDGAVVKNMKPQDLNKDNEFVKTLQNGGDVKPAVRPIKQAGVKRISISQQRALANAQGGR